MFRNLAVGAGLVRYLVLTSMIVFSMLKSLVKLDRSVTHVTSLAAALRQKAAPLALDLEASEDLQCRNLLCEKVGEACICRLSHVLESLKDLRHLSLASNQLAHLPASIWKQKGLVSLDLSNNLLIDLPRECAELISLQVLDVRGNSSLQDLPQDLKAMSGLSMELPEHLALKDRQTY